MSNDAPSHTDLMVTPESIDAFIVENPPPEPIDYGDWKETVMDIFDTLHFRDQSVFNNALARKIVGMIEKRHANYFCGDDAC